MPPIWMAIDGEVCEATQGVARECEAAFLNSMGFREVGEIEVADKFVEDDSAAEDFTDFLAVRRRNADSARQMARSPIRRSSPV
jgi:hypothetical protein